MANPAVTDNRMIRRGPYPELTLPAILVGYGLGILIALSIGYAALILGFSIEGSELAAILGFGILRGLMGRTSIVENNINQTIASAVNGASAGMMFTVPALFILGETDFNVVLMVFACIAGGVLGIGFIIPLRKQMIDFERLTYPGGVAVATILKSPGAGVHKAVLLLSGAFVSALIHFVSQSTGFENWNLGGALGMPDYMNGIWYVSLLTIGVGFIAGRGGFFFIVGGYVCYWILAPLLAGMDLLPTAAALAEADMGMAGYLRVALFRPVGIGMLIGGALMGIVLALPLIVRAAIDDHLTPGDLGGFRWLAAGYLAAGCPGTCSRPPALVVPSDRSRRLPRRPGGVLDRSLGTAREAGRGAGGIRPRPGGRLLRTLRRVDRPGRGDRRRLRILPGRPASRRPGRAPRPVRG